MKYLIWVIPMIITLTMLFIFTGCGKNEAVETKNQKDVKEASDDADTYSVDLSTSRIEWIGKKVTGQHNGTVDIASGELQVTDNELEAGRFEIDFTTIKDLDLENPETNAKLTNHLKSEAFFSTVKFPKAIFEITKLEKANDGKGNNYEVDGNLTIKGITKNISFPAKINIENGKLTSTADFDIDRTQWDIKFRSGKFFENLGDKLINDEFNIKFNITAVRG